MRRGRQLKFLSGVLLAAACMTVGRGQADAYFEHRYFCEVEANAITVSIQPDTGSTYCFNHVADIHQQLQKINTDLTTALQQIDDGEDVAYWTEVAEGLEAEKKLLLNLKNQFVAAINDYESDLFRRVKVILAYYLRDEKKQIVEQLDQAELLLDQYTSVGSREEFIEVQSQIDALAYKLQLLNSIRDASGFSELMSPLKRRLLLQQEEAL